MKVVTMNHLRQLSSVTSTASVRMATLEGTTHVVLPVVALKGDSVIRGMNSQGPEFVPAHVLQRSTMQWNGKPVTYDHPYNGSDTANTPATWEQYRMGTIFSAVVENGDLKYELWLDPGRADKLGSAAQDVIRKVNNKELVEGSTGCYVNVQPRRGRHNGQSYEYEWVEIIAADHYAFGLNGSQGACSVADGCGGPRINKSKGFNDNSYTLIDTPILYVNDKGRYEFRLQKGGKRCGR